MRAYLAISLGLFSISCQPANPCESIDGSCLLLNIEGEGTYSEIGTLLIGVSGSVKRGDSNGTAIKLPHKVYLPPPPGISTSSIRGVAVEGLQDGQVTANALTSEPFSWPDGEHIEATVTLSAGGAIPPGPLLRWRSDVVPSGIKENLQDVWIATSGDPIIAVGGNGTILAKVGGTWKAEASGINSYLYSVAGFSDGVAFAVAQSTMSETLRRPVAGGNWVPEAGIMMGRELWSVAAGPATGELWVGDDEGRVWHRTGPTTSTGTWMMEQALPAGNGVYGVAQAGGAVFAVGDKGHVAVRKPGMTTWTQTQITGGFSSNDWWNAVHAFDGLTAVAAGRAGAIVTYQGGNWSTSAQKVGQASEEFFGVWGTDPNKVWLTSGAGRILRVDGQKTYELYSNASVALYSIDGRSASDIFVVGGATGQASLILHGTP
jgi:hypothetical protein